VARTGEPCPVQPPSFDAVITLGPQHLPPGISPARAVAAVRQAVQAMPGAGWISVEHHAVGFADGAVEVFPAGSSRPGDEAIRRNVEQTITTAVGGLPAHLLRGEILAANESYPIVEARIETAGFSDLQQFQLPKPASMAAPISEGHGSRGPLGPTLGLAALTDTDLLARLLGYVVPVDGERAATAAIRRFGSFAAVLSAPEAQLKQIPGLGTHSLAAIKLFHAAALRLSKAAVMDQPVLDDDGRLVGYLTAVLAREPIEHFRVLFLDDGRRLMADEAQARGTVDHTPVYPREVVRRALELKAASIILVHNHPSGDPTPSPADLEMTAQVEAAAAVLGVAVHDHIIVGRGQWLSFRKEGLLQQAARPPADEASF